MMPMDLTRRDAIILGAAAFCPMAPRAFAQDAPPPADSAPRHGMSAYGDLRYPADFPHFDYVNPQAPKGGRLSYSPSTWAFNQNPNTFNSLNSLIYKGDAPIGILNIFATLMARAWDEPDALYGYLAHSVAIEDGGKLYRFHLRPEARFHDGTPLTAEDVAFSINLLRTEGHPLITQSLLDVVGAEAASPHEALVRFTGTQARDTPLFLATLPILSKAYYSARPFNETTMDPPLGSGPYKVGRISAGRFIEYERMKDWWDADLPVNRGQNNFDVVRVEFFRDREAALEGFKGGHYLFREEFTSRLWAKAYDFPAIRNGRVVRFELPDNSPSGAQGWWINTRRQKFSDPRVREALIMAFDFEWTNANLMYGAYRRTSSVFEQSTLKANGPPSPEELVLLEPFRGKVPDAVFGEPYVPPVSDGSGQDRALLRRARELLAGAGWTVKDGALKNAAGETFTIEILDDDPIFEPHVLAYIKNLRILGIQASFRVVDASQFQSRQQSFDFDMMPRRWSFSETPGDDLRQFFGSRAASTNGSNNLSGVSDPVIDALIEKIVTASTRDELIIAARALDRVFRAGKYWVPHWYQGAHKLAMWDVFGRPEKKPHYALPFDTTWWFEPEKAERLGIRI